MMAEATWNTRGAIKGVTKKQANGGDGITFGDVSRHLFKSRDTAGKQPEAQTCALQCIGRARVWEFAFCYFPCLFVNPRVPKHSKRLGVVRAEKGAQSRPRFYVPTTSTGRRIPALTGMFMDGLHIKRPSASSSSSLHVMANKQVHASNTSHLGQMICMICMICMIYSRYSS